MVEELKELLRELRETKEVLRGMNRKVESVIENVCTEDTIDF